MPHHGFYPNFMFFSFIPVLIWLVSLILLIVALFNLKSRSMNATAKALWVLVCFMPFFGPIAFWIVNPEDKESQA